LLGYGGGGTFFVERLDILLIDHIDIN
jgi:hypothetical protein